MRVHSYFGIGFPEIVYKRSLLIELKAIKEVDKSCYNQIINYLKIFDLEVGSLLNFGVERLQFKMLIYYQNKPQNPS